MRKQLFEYTREHGSVAIYNSLAPTERTILDKFKDYMLISASESRSKEAVREIVRFREVLGKNLDKIDLEDMRYYLLQLKQSSFADHSKNKIKGYIQRFLRWKFKDWSLRFDNFEDIKYNSDAQRKKEISSKTMLKPEEIEKLIEAEKSLFWKTFLKVQYTGALRTGETRALTWDAIKFNDDNFCYIRVLSKKNKNATNKERTIPLDKGATYFLLELKKQQKTLGIDTKWVFPSPHNPNKHISKGANDWFKRLTKKVLGREVTNYTLRHTKATELKEKVKRNEMSLDNATEFMGHSERMFNKTYSHMDKEDVVKIIQEQLYGFKPLSDDEKSELEVMKKRIELLGKNNKILTEYVLGTIKEKIEVFNITLLKKPKDKKLIQERERYEKILNNFK
jgi:integrase